MIKINLLSPEKKDISTISETTSFVEEPRENKLNIPAILTALLISVGIIGYMYITQTTTLKNKQKYLQERKLRLTELEQVLKELEKLEKTRDLLARKAQIIEDLKALQQKTVKMMDYLSNSLPEWVWLTQLNFSGSTLTLSGRALTNSLIADFMNNLKASNFFHNIQFRDSQRRMHQGQEILDFRITCVYQEIITNKKVG